MPFNILDNNFFISINLSIFPVQDVAFKKTLFALYVIFFIERYIPKKQKIKFAYIYNFVVFFNNKIKLEYENIKRNIINIKKQDEQKLKLKKVFNIILNTIFNKEISIIQIVFM